MKKFLTLGVILIAVIASCTESQKRSLKSTKSEWTGGLERTVTLYDYSGKPIKSWSGKFDVEYTDRNSAYFDISEKRVMISGGIIVNEEK